MEIFAAVVFVGVALVMIAVVAALVWFGSLFMIAMFRTVVHEVRKPLGSGPGRADHVDDDEIDGMNEGDFRRYL